MTKACLKDNRPFGVCLITQGDEVASPAGAAPEIRQRRHAGADRRLGHAAARHPARRDARAKRASRCAGMPSQRSGLVVGEVTPIAAEPQLALADELPAARQPARVDRDARRPAEFSRGARRTATRRGSATDWPSCCRCRCTSSRACSKSTMPKCASRCCSSSWRSRESSDAFQRDMVRSAADGPSIISASWQTASAKTPWPATASGRTSSTRRPRPTPSAARSSRASSRKSRSRRAWAAATRR